MDDVHDEAERVGGFLVAGAPLEVGDDGGEGEYGHAGAGNALDELEDVGQGFPVAEGALPFGGEVFGDGFEDDLRAEASESAFDGLQRGGAS